MELAENNDIVNDKLINELNDETEFIEPDSEDIDFNNDELKGELIDNEIEKEQIKTEKKISPKRAASVYVRLLDTGNKLILPTFYKKKNFSKSEIERLKHIASEEMRGISFLTDEDIKLKTKETEIKKLIETIPLDDDEKKELIECLADCLEIWGGFSNPVVALIFTLIIIEGQRFLPLFNKNILD